MNARQVGGATTLVALFCLSLIGCGDRAEELPLDSSHTASLDTASPDTESSRKAAPRELSQRHTLQDAGLIRVEALSSRSRSTDPEVAETLFKLRTPDETGVDWVAQFPDDAPPAAISDHYSGTGVCLGDADLDGLPDIYVTGYDRGNRLYRNLGGFRFQDVTVQSGVGGGGRWCSGACFADVDNDNDLDLVVCVYDAPNLLYINRGNGQFDEQAQRRGLDYSGASVMFAMADYDRDGDLDAYLVTHRMNVGTDFHMPRSTADAMQRGILEKSTGDSKYPVRVAPAFRELFQIVDRGNGRVELVTTGQRDYLYQNNGDGFFQVVNPTAGISGYGIGLAASWWDYNNDGWLDLYVSNDYKGADQLYHNLGDGTFKDVVRAATPHVPWFSMGSATADVNNDGRIDLLASDMSGTTHYRQKVAMGDMQKERWFLEVARPRQYMRNALYLNTSTSRLLEVAQLAGVANTNWTWSPLFGDLDNDGWTDLFVSNGMSRDFMDSDLRRRIKSKQSEQWSAMPVLREANLAFRNNGRLGFDEVGPKWGLDQLSASYGAALGDLDHDGDLDLVVTDFEKPLQLLENQSFGNRAALIRLIGQSSNRWGIGATVYCTTSQGTQVVTVSSCQGVMSSSEPIVHIGMGDDSGIQKLTVTWPSGTVQDFYDLPAGHLISISESDVASPRMAKVPARSPAARPEAALFATSSQLSWLVHEESTFNDFEKQPLLPARLSRQGPGLAVGDVNQDGVEDVFLSGAANRRCRIVDGATLREIPNDCFVRTRSTEQLGGVFFDVDGDRDLDLYVVNGSVEVAAGSNQLRDALYLNDGTGRFSVGSKEATPTVNESGSCVVAADYDRDGDVDLFVGGWTTPGDYPMSPSSRLLRNDRGKLVVDEAAFGPNAEESAPVRTTSALWSDVDGDGWIDLLVTQHWGPIRYFRNQAGTLTDHTDRSGLSQWQGWWNGIAGGDFDGDGDIDYAVTNHGLNSKYHATAHRPVVLYYGDFGGKGDLRIVEASYEDDVLYPARGLSCSTAAIPALSERFNSYHQFARATLDEIYSPALLNNAMRLEVNTLESGVLWNNADGFRFEPLPRIAQVSAAYGVSVRDFDGDGHLDIYLVHNSHSPQPETGNLDGGMSQLLRGHGNRTFLPMGAAESGLIVPGDAKSLVVCDRNADQRPDLLIGVNDSGVRTFLNRSVADSYFQIKLEGADGNMEAIGARLEATLTNGERQVAEVYAGGGYLSQSSRVLTIGLGDAKVKQISVRWPDGAETQHTPRRNAVQMAIRKNAE